MMVHLTSLNVVEKLIIASYNLEKNGESPFSAEDLVVSAWENFPDTFGLRGYRDKNGKLKYPDSNRVYAEIMGSKPIRQRGYLAKVGTKKYQLTESGKEFAKFLINRTSQIVIEKAGLPREIETGLKILLDSRAVRKIMTNRESEVTFFDACNFWKISPRSTPIELEGKVKNIENILNIVKKATKNKTVTFEHRGQTFSSKDVNTLKEIHKTLLSKFKKELETISTRKKEH